MEIIEIKYYSNESKEIDKPKSQLRNILEIILEGLIVLIVITLFIILFIIGLIILPIKALFDFIKKKKFKKQIKKSTKSIIFQNEIFKLIKNDEKSEEDVYGWDFWVDITGTDDLWYLYKLGMEPECKELNNCLFTDFILETVDELVFQRIYKLNKEETSDLVSINKYTTEFNKLCDIGMYLIDSYSENNKILSGYNKKGNIKIKINSINKKVTILKIKSK